MSRLLASLLLCASLLLPGQGWAVVTDAFTGTDGTALPTYSANWVNPNSGLFNNLAIKSNAARGATVGASIYTGATFSNDQYVQATVVNNNPTDQMYVVVRWTNGQSNDGYGGGVVNAGSDLKYKIIRRSDGSTLAVTAAQTMQVGDVIKLSAVGTALTLTVNGVDILSTTDGGDASGSPGLYIYDSTATNPMLDDFEAGDIGGAPNFFPRRLTP